MKALRITGYLVGGLIAVIALALVLIVVFVDPNDYRDDIAQAVEKQTGRQLNLSGDLKLSVFPWLALDIGAATLSDAPGFGDEPFVSINRARVGARLLPLLRGKVEVGKVALEGARVRLLTDAQGRNNWADLGQHDTGTGTAAAQDTAPTRWPTIAGVEVKDATVTIDNRQDNTRRVVRNFNLTTGPLQSGEPFDVTMQFVLEQDPSAIKVHLSSSVVADLEQNIYRLAKPAIDITLSGPTYPAPGLAVEIRAGSASADIGRKLHQLEGLTLNTRWKGEGYPADGVPVALRIQNLNANLAAQTLEMLGFEAEVAGAHLTGSLAGTDILDAPKLTGPLKLQPLSLREWLPKLGIKLPPTRDATVYKTLSFSGRVSATKTTADVGEIALQLDDTTAKGSLGVADFAAKALRFDLDVDRINADRYLAPPVDRPVAAASKKPPAEIPVDMLRALNARGELRVGEAIFAGIKFTKLRLGLSARDGRVRFNPSEASMYGGQYRGDIGIDATGKVASVSLDEHVSNVNFAPLFKDLFETERFSGRGNANIKLAGSGRTTDAVMQTMNGTVDFKVADGALEGADLTYEIRRARALLKQQTVPERSGPARTAFSALQGSGVMRNGILANNDLNVAMPLLKVTGQGTVDLPKNTLDYRLVAAVLKVPRENADAAELQDMVDAAIPVKVSGSLSDPKVRPDVEGYLKEEMKQRVEKERGKVEEKVKEKLGDKLKNLLGR